MKTYKLALMGIVGSLTFFGSRTTLPGAATNIVGVRGPASFVFVPTNLVITVGDTVLWTNQSSTTHDIAEGTFSGGLTPSPYWVKTALPLLGSFSVTFSNAGVYPYICNQHVFVTPQPPGNPTQTGTVSVVTGNLCPTVSMTSPTNLTRLTAPAAFTITADAADGDGTVTNVQFFANTTLLGSDSTVPYSLHVTGLAAGWYRLTARATDDQGTTTTSAQVNLLVNSNRVVVTSGFSFVPNVLSLTLEDTVTFNGLSGFHTVTGDTAAEPFCGSAFPVSCEVTFHTVGNFPFHCIPHQSLGMTGAVAVAGPNLPPFVVMTSPSDGSMFSAPATITLSADASDFGGLISRLRFVRSATISMGLVTNQPYTLTASNLAAGNYVLTALATDNTGLTSTSAPVRVSVVALSDIRLLSPTFGSEGFQFNFATDPGLSYVVEGSASEMGISPFVPLITNVATTNVTTFIDPATSSRSNRMYRVFRQP
jgi:plastocyanin